MWIEGRKVKIAIFGAILALGFISVFFISLPKAKAFGDHIVINEIYPNSELGENEWIELYNPTSSDILLSEYTIEDGGRSPKKLFGKAIEAGKYLLLVRDTDFTFGLNNNGDLVILKNGIEEIDYVEYGNFNSSKSKSFARIPNGSDTDIDVDDFRVIDPSPGEENLLAIYSDKIIINEIVPQPATGSADEFIELYNSGGVVIDLSGWQIDDIEGGSSPYLIPKDAVINPGEYLIFQNNMTKISFNDSGDSARLIDPNGDQKDIVTYGKSIRGQSYSKFGDNWLWTTTLTLAIENILTVEIMVEDKDIQIFKTDILGARNQPDGKIVQVTGVVTVPPEKLSLQYFYIQDENSGIQIYNYNKLFSSLTAGDQIKVIGEMGSISNERRIKTSLLSDIEIISTRSPPAVANIRIDQIDENFEGQYIRVVGKVTKTSGNTFYISGSGPKGAPFGGEIQVSIREGTGIKKPKMRVGDTVEVAGVLSQYKDYYRILPTRQDDVKIIKSLSLAKSGSGIDFPLLLSGVITFIWIIYQKVKKKLPALPA